MAIDADGALGGLFAACLLVTLNVFLSSDITPKRVGNYLE